MSFQVTHSPRPGPGAGRVIPLAVRVPPLSQSKKCLALHRGAADPRRQDARRRLMRRRHPPPSLLTSTLPTFDNHCDVDVARPPQTRPPRRVRVAICIRLK